MSRRSKPQGLTYIGQGASLPGLPARDLRPDELEALGGAEALLATGLYASDAEPEPVSVPVVEVETDEEPDADA